MSLKPTPTGPVPKETARVAEAAFPNGNPYLTLREKLGTAFGDEDFADLYPDCGQPAYTPWRLALITLLQFREDLADRQAAAAVRARIDWKYLLGLELTDAGFDFSVLSEFRQRLLDGGAEHRLLEKLLVECQELGLLKKRGRQRTDCTRVLAAVRRLSRLELLGEAMRAVLNEIATEAPKWLKSFAPLAWYERYGRRVEEHRLPRSKAKRKAYAREVGEDGFALLGALESPDAPDDLIELPKVEVLRRVWEVHYMREGEGPEGTIRLTTRKERPARAEEIESPYDSEAKFCRRQDKNWTGYRVHFSETCDDGRPRLITATDTTIAPAHEVRRIGPIHNTLAEKGLLPRKHLVDSAYASADSVVESRTEHGVKLVGPAMPNSSWQSKSEEAFGTDDFEIDWTREEARCPEGNTSEMWTQIRERGKDHVRIRFAAEDCHACPSRELCTTAKKYGRQLTIRPQKQHEALQEARQGSAGYRLRQGIEGTISQGVRVMGLRQTRYRGVAKTRLQHLATAAAINLDRLVGWFEDRPLAKTRVSHFAALMAAA